MQIAAGCGAGLGVEVRVGHEVEQLGADLRRDERAQSGVVGVEKQDRQAENVAVEAERAFEVLHAQHEVVEVGNVDHGVPSCLEFPMFS